MTIGAVFVLADRVTHVTRNLVVVRGVLNLFCQIVGLVTIRAFRVDVFVHVGARLAVAVE